MIHPYERIEVDYVPPSRPEHIVEDGIAKNGHGEYRSLFIDGEEVQKDTPHGWGNVMRWKTQTDQWKEREAFGDDQMYEVTTYLDNPSESSSDTGAEKAPSGDGSEPPFSPRLPARLVSWCLSWSQRVAYRLAFVTALCGAGLSNGVACAAKIDNLEFIGVGDVLEIVSDPLPEAETNTHRHPNGAVQSLLSTGGILNVPLGIEWRGKVGRDGSSEPIASMILNLLARLYNNPVLCHWIKNACYWSRRLHNASRYILHINSGLVVDHSTSALIAYAEQNAMPFRVVLDPSDDQSSVGKRQGLLSDRNRLFGSFIGLSGRLELIPYVREGQDADQRSDSSPESPRVLTRFGEAPPWLGLVIYGGAIAMTLFFFSKGEKKVENK